VRSGAFAGACWKRPDWKEKFGGYTNFIEANFNLALQRAIRLVFNGDPYADLVRKTMPSQQILFLAHFLEQEQATGGVTTAELLIRKREVDHWGYERSMHCLTIEHVLHEVRRGDFDCYFWTNEHSPRRASIPVDP